MHIFAIKHLLQKKSANFEIIFVSFIFFANLVENCMYVFFAPSSNICLFFMIFLFLFRDWMTTMELEASLYHASDHNLIMNGIMSNGSKSLGTSSAAASSSPESEEGIVSREVSSAAGGNVSSRRRKVQNFVLLFFILSFFFTSFSPPRLDFCCGGGDPPTVCFAFDSTRSSVNIGCRRSNSAKAATLQLSFSVCLYRLASGDSGRACHRFASPAFLKKQDTIINKLSKKKPSASLVQFSGGGA